MDREKIVRILDFANIKVKKQGWNYLHYAMPSCEQIAEGFRKFNPSERPFLPLTDGNKSFLIGEDYSTMFDFQRDYNYTVMDIPKYNGDLASRVIVADSIDDDKYNGKHETFIFRDKRCCLLVESTPENTDITQYNPYSSNLQRWTLDENSNEITPSLIHNQYYITKRLHNLNTPQYTNYRIAKRQMELLPSENPIEDYQRFLKEQPTM